MNLLYFDENVPYKFVRGLALIEEGNTKSQCRVQILHPRDVGMEGKTDQDHIKYVGIKNGVIISFDKDFRHMKSYYTLYNEYGVGAVVLNLSKRDSNYWGIVRTIINHWEKMKSILSDEKLPFVLEITSRGVERRQF